MDYKSKLEHVQNQIQSLKARKVMVDEMLEKRRAENQAVRDQLIAQGVNVDDLPTEKEEIQQKIESTFDKLEKQLETYQQEIERIQKAVM